MRTSKRYFLALMIAGCLGVSIAGSARSANAQDEKKAEETTPAAAKPAPAEAPAVATPAVPA